MLNVRFALSWSYDRWRALKIQKGDGEFIYIDTL